MLSSWCHLFSQEKSHVENYFDLGGPRSFHKFSYKKMNIILIGEVHSDMENRLAQEYLNIFNQFIESNKVKIFIESTHDDITEPTANLSFIDCMRKLTHSDNLTRINSDKRYYDDGFKGLYIFLQYMSDMVENITKEVKKQGVTPPSPMIFSTDEGFIKIIDDIASSCNKDLRIPDYFKFLETSLDILLELEKKYSVKNLKLGAFIAEHYLEVSQGYHSLKFLEKTCRSMGYDEEKIKTQPIIDICIDMMKFEKTFSPAEDWLEIYSAYVSSFLNATLACDLWDEIEKACDEEITLIVATGDAHTQELAELFKETCYRVASIDANKKGEVLSPGFIKEFLGGNFDHAPIKCAIF